MTNENSAVQEFLSIPSDVWPHISQYLFDVVIVTDIKGNVLHINRTAEWLDPRMVMGKTVSDFIIDEHRKFFLDNFNDALNTKRTIVYRLSGFGGKGAVEEYLGRIIPIIENEKVSKMVLAAINITDINNRLADKATGTTEILEPLA